MNGRLYINSYEEETNRFIHTEFLTQNETVIMVDDDVTTLTVARNNLSGRYNFFTAPSGAKLFQVLKKIKPDLILLDVELPEINGYEIIRLLKGAEMTAHIPVIFLTAKPDPENEVRGIESGAADYVTKPYSNELLTMRIDMHLMLERQRKELVKYDHNLRNEIVRKTKFVCELQTTILKAVAELVERRDNAGGGHIERTQRYLELLEDFLLGHGVYTKELSGRNIKMFIMSSQLHEVGKISIQDEILTRPAS